MCIGGEVLEMMENDEDAKLVKDRGVRLIRGLRSTFDRLASVWYALVGLLIARGIKPARIAWLGTSAGRQTLEKIADTMAAILAPTAVLAPAGKPTGWAKSTSGQFANWYTLYKKHFGIDLELDAVGAQIPERQEGFDRLIVVAKGITIDNVYGVCAKLFSCRRYADELDARLVKDDRDPVLGSYAVWVRDMSEADEGTRRFSANDLAEQKFAGITLLERLLLELVCFEESEGHLDLKFRTLCSGSRFAGDAVPTVYTLGGRLKISSVYVGDRCDDLGARKVIA
jgi:hypothetical protein